MKIRNVVHKGLHRLIAENNAAGIQPSLAPKLRRMVSYLQEMEHEYELHSMRSWRPHTLSGDRKGYWSLVVSKNWRLTFRVDRDTMEIIDLNFEDYH